MNTAAPIRAGSALLDLVGRDLRAPLVDGSTVHYANLDCAASTPALQAVVDHLTEVLPFYSSVHRGAGYASAVSTALYETSRATIGAFAGARDDDVTIIARNTTDAIEILARALPAGGRVLVLDIEHHANLLPWRRSDDTGTSWTGRSVVRAHQTLGSTLDAVREELSSGDVALLAVTGASNVTGEILPLSRLTDLAHSYGARIFVDAAQLAPHRPFSLRDSDIDYVAFSGHKLYAPFGAGALVGRRDWLDAAPPYLAGGGAVREVGIDAVSWAPAPARHEAGTPNVLGAAALAEACRTLRALPEGELEAHEHALRQLLVDGLSHIPGIRVLRLWGELDTTATVSFVVAGYPADQVAGYLSAEHGIGVRDGRFCAHPFLTRLGARGGAVRASAGVGSTVEEIERLLGALRTLLDGGPRARYRSDDGDAVPYPDPRPFPAWATHDGAVGFSCLDPTESSAAQH